MYIVSHGGLGGLVVRLVQARGQTERHRLHTTFTAHGVDYFRIRSLPTCSISTELLGCSLVISLPRSWLCSSLHIRYPCPSSVLILFHLPRESVLYVASWLCSYVFSSVRRPVLLPSGIVSCHCVRRSPFARKAPAVPVSHPDPMSRHRPDGGTRLNRIQAVGMSMTSATAVGPLVSAPSPPGIPRAGTVVDPVGMPGHGRE